MKLIFSTSFSGRIFKNQSTTGERYIDRIQLLTILEREIGLYKEYISEEERLKCYLTALDSQKKGTFYEKSLKNDQYKVTKELLFLRDELVFGGWNIDVPNQPTRLNDLALVEKVFIELKGNEGEVDRWLNVLKHIETRADLILDFELIVKDNPTLLYPLLNRIFDKLEVSFVHEEFHLHYSIDNLSKFKSTLAKSFSTTKNTNIEPSSFVSYKDDDSLLLLKFPNKQILIDTIAYLSDYKKDVIVGNDITDFDFSLVSQSKNASGSIQINSNPQIIQLFKLVVTCFSKFDIHSFVSLLQQKYSPIPYQLRSQLLSIILQKPGFGNQDWNDCIENFIADKDHEKSEKVRRKIVELFLTFDGFEEQKAVHKSKEIVDYLIDWSGSLVHQINQVEIKEQLTYLNKLFKKVNTLIADIEDLRLIENAFNTVYESSNFTNFIKQQNSVLALKDFSKFISDCEFRVVNIDFYNQENEFSLTKYLLANEIKFLKSNNIYYDFYYDLKISQQLKGLQKVKEKLVLCYFEDEKIEKHPFHIRLESFFSESLDLISFQVKSIQDLRELFAENEFVENLTSSTQINLPSSSDYFIHNNLDFPIRQKESASSIEKFIQYPFDWIMEYQLKMRAYNGLELGNEHQMKGNIAHKVIENCLNRFIGVYNGNIEIIENDFEEEFNKVIQQQGVLFLQPEKRFELSEFKKRFKASFYSLIQFINQNELSVLSCEKSFGNDESIYLDELDTNVGGYIDLVLQKNDGTYVILDLKWTYSSKKFEQKIKDNEAIQLAIYTAAMNQINNAQTGYYLLNQNKLITSHDFVGDNIQTIPSNYSSRVILDKVRASVNFRRRELLEGKIEIGDLINLDRLEYVLNENLIQLPEDRKMKSTNKYSGFELFKGQLN